MPTAVCLAFWAIGLLVMVSADNKRSDDTSLGSVTIQTLQARLDTQDSKHEEQVAALQARLDTQDAKHEQQVAALQARVDKQDETIAGLRSTQKTIRSTPRKTVGFLADMYNHQPSYDTTLPKGVPVKFNNIITNLGHAYNSFTGIFTAPCNGLYIFNLRFWADLYSSYTMLGIYNGNHLKVLAYADGDNKEDNDQGSVTAILHLIQGREVSVKVYKGDGKIWATSLTSFSGALLHAD